MTGADKKSVHVILLIRMGISMWGVKEMPK